MANMRMVQSSFLIVALMHPAFPADSDSGSLCVAPFLVEPDHRAAPGLFCEPQKLSLKIDTQPAMPWPLKQNVKVDGLDAGVRHKVVVFCDGRPQQSFTFRFSEYAARELCLFLNDLYKTVQLTEAKRSPWCKCK